MAIAVAQMRGDNLPGGCLILYILLTFLCPICTELGIYHVHGQQQRGKGNFPSMML